MIDEDKKNNIEFVALSEEDQLECNQLLESMTLLCIGFEVEKVMAVLSFLICNVSVYASNYTKSEFINYMSYQWHFAVDNENPKYIPEGDR